MSRFPLAVLIAALAFSATAAPILLGPEIPISSPEYDEPFDVQRNARIDTDGSGFLATWTDHRNGYEEVFGARFTAEGEVLDPLGIHFGRGVSGDVVWTGSTYLVAWQSGAADVSVTTVDPDGTVGAPRHVLTAQLTPVWPIDLTRGATTVLLTTNSRNGALLTPDGDTVKLLNIPNSQVGSAAAFAAGKYQLVTTGQGFLGYTEIDESGTVRQYCCGNVGNAIPESPESVDVASDGTRHIVAWTKTHLTAELWTPQNVRIRKTTMSDRRAIGSAHLTWRGSEYLLLLSEDGLLYTARLNDNGIPIGVPSEPFAETTPGEGADVVSRADGSGAVVWVDVFGGVRAGFFDSASIEEGKEPVFDIFTLTRSAAQQIAPRLTRAGDELFAAWLEPHPATTDLKLARLGGEPVTVTEFGGNFEVVADRDNNLIWVVWIDGDDVLFRRYTRALVAIDEEPVEVEVPGFADLRLSAAAGGGSLLLLWHTNERPHTLVGTLLRSDGADVEQIDVPIAFEAEQGRDGVAAWDGSTFVVVWPHATPFSSLAIELLMQHVTASGSTLDAPSRIFAANTLNALQADGVDGKVVLGWQSNNVTYAANIGAGGAPVPRVVAQIGVGEEVLSRIVPLRTGQSLFAWSRQDGGTGTVRIERVSADLVAQGDTAIHSVEIPLLDVPDPSFMTWFDIGAIGIHPALAYTRTTLDEEYAGAPRIFVRRAGIKRRAVR